MTDSKAVRPGQFVKGDPRINKAGNKSVDAQKWAIRFRECLVKKLPPEKAVAVLIKAYMRGQSWAVEEVNSRLMGKVSQPVTGDVKVDGRLVIEVVKTT